VEYQELIQRETIIIIDEVLEGVVTLGHHEGYCLKQGMIKTVY
jgi:hypothetical protein